MTAGRATYDTAPGIRSHLADGIDGLRRLVRARHEAGYDRREDLGEFLVCEGRYWLDRCGNTMACKVTLEAEQDVSLQGMLPAVLPFDELRRTLTRVRTEGTLAAIPPASAACPECAESWDLRNCHDVTAWRGDDDAWTFRHKLCAELVRERDRANWYRDVCRDAGLGDMVLVPVPSGYFKGDPSWCQIRTPKGNVVIGWRKRVVNVDWSGMVTFAIASLPKSGDYAADYKAKDDVRGRFDGEKLFASEDVTKGSTMVHAWTREKLIEYLRIVSEVARIGAFKPVAG